MILLIFSALAIYLGVGLFALLLFDVCTKRLTSRFGDASTEARATLAASGSLVGSKTAKVLTALAVWLLWPFVFIGAMTGGKGKE